MSLSRYPAQPSGSIRSEQGLRQRARTRARLSQLALELFADQGYDQTTAAQIAAAAGVTERTFFNHFETKLDAIFPRGEYTSFTDLRRMIAERPPGDSDLDVLCECGLEWIIADTAENLEWQYRMERLRLQISETSATVRGMRATAHTELGKAMLAGLVARSGRSEPTPEQDVLATAVAATIHGAFIRWVESDDVLGFERIARARVGILLALAKGEAAGPSPAQAAPADV
jgi:AcrR family transcriptional regulator